MASNAEFGFVTGMFATAFLGVAGWVGGSYYNHAKKARQQREAALFRQLKIIDTIVYRLPEKEKKEVELIAQKRYNDAQESKHELSSQARQYRKWGPYVESWWFI